MTFEIWDLTDTMYTFNIELVAHERCSTVKINSDNHNSDIDDDYTCIFSNLSKSTKFVVFVNNAILLMDVEKLQTYLNVNHFSVKMVAVFHI